MLIFSYGTRFLKPFDENYGKNFIVETHRIFISFLYCLNSWGLRFDCYCLEGKNE